MMKTWFDIVLVGSAKISYIWGSNAAFFSLMQCLRPLIGLYAGIPGVLVQGIFYGAKVLLTGSFLLSPLVFHVPTVCSSLYWATTSRWVRLGIPLVCMVAFVLHPVGCQAAFYVLFWLIPVGIYCMGRPSVFLHALASTFIAHAVGSVIWLYCVPMQPGMFVGLVPVVIVERLLFATGMTLIYYMVDFVKNLCQRILRETFSMHHGW